MVRVSVVGWFVGGGFGCWYEPVVAHNYESATFSSPALDANNADCNADCDARQPLLSYRVSFVSAGTDKAPESRTSGCTGWRLWRGGLDRPLEGLPGGRSEDPELRQDPLRMPRWWY